MVGAVLVRGGDVVGEGWHEGPGTPHAEATALARAGRPRARRHALRHPRAVRPSGRTPPVPQAILEAGVARGGRGHARPEPGRRRAGLRQARAARASGRARACWARGGRQIAGVRPHVTTELPFVTLKVAATLDGKVGRSGRFFAVDHRRGGPGGRPRLRAASDASWSAPGPRWPTTPRSRCATRGYAGRPAAPRARGRRRARAGDRAAVRRRGPDAGGDHDGALRTATGTWRAPPARRWSRCRPSPAVASLAASCSRFSASGTRSRCCSRAGPTLAGSAVRDGLVDRVVLYLAPKLIGGVAARPACWAGRGSRPCDRAVARSTIVSAERIGEDLKVEADVHRDR